MKNGISFKLQNASFRNAAPGCDDYSTHRIRCSVLGRLKKPPMQPLHVILPS
jgi:hypothetical protein